MEAEIRVMYFEDGGRARSYARNVALEPGKGKEMDFSLEPPEGRSSCLQGRPP